MKMEIALKAGNVVCIQYAAEQTIIRTIQFVRGGLSTYGGGTPRRC